MEIHAGRGAQSALRAQGRHLAGEGRRVCPGPVAARAARARVGRAVPQALMSLVHALAALIPPLDPTRAMCSCGLTFQRDSQIPVAAPAPDSSAIVSES